MISRLKPEHAAKVIGVTPEEAKGLLEMGVKVYAHRHEWEPFRHFDDAYECWMNKSGRLSWENAPGIIYFVRKEDGER